MIKVFGESVIVLTSAIVQMLDVHVYVKHYNIHVKNIANEHCKQFRINVYHD